MSIDKSELIGSHGRWAIEHSGEIERIVWRREYKEDKEIPSELEGETLCAGPGAL